MPPVSRVIDTSEHLRKKPLDSAKKPVAEFTSIFIGLRVIGLLCMLRTARTFLTGASGSGKSIELLKVIGRLRVQVLRVGGIVTPKLKRQDKRIGFKVVDLASWRDAALASTDRVSGLQVGRYKVDLQALGEVALPALEHAVGGCGVVAVDEIGRMELLSEPFRKTVERIPRLGLPIDRRRPPGVYAHLRSTRTPDHRHSRQQGKPPANNCLGD